jgi:hypothetical protein
MSEGTFSESGGQGFARDQQCPARRALLRINQERAGAMSVLSGYYQWLRSGRAAAALGAIASLAVAAPCAQHFWGWRTLERALASSACGDLQGAMTLGQCSHCWGVAAVVLLVSATFCAHSAMATSSAQIIPRGRASLR